MHVFRHRFLTQFLQHFTCHQVWISVSTECKAIHIWNFQSLLRVAFLTILLRKKHISRPLGRGPCKNKKYHAMSKMIVCFCALWGSLAPSDHTKQCRSMLRLFIARGHGHWACEKKFYPLLPQLVRSPNFRKLRSGDPKPLQILKISWRIRVHFRAKN